MFTLRKSNFHRHVKEEDVFEEQKMNEGKTEVDRAREREREGERERERERYG